MIVRSGAKCWMVTLATRRQTQRSPTSCGPARSTSTRCYRSADLAVPASAYCFYERPRLIPRTLAGRGSLRSFLLAWTRWPGEEDCERLNLFVKGDPDPRFANSVAPVRRSGSTARRNAKCGLRMPCGGNLSTMWGGSDSEAYVPSSWRTPQRPGTARMGPLLRAAIHALVKTSAVPHLAQSSEHPDTFTSFRRPHA